MYIYGLTAAEAKSMLPKAEARLLRASLKEQAAQQTIYMLQSIVMTGGGYERGWRKGDRGVADGFEFVYEGLERDVLSGEPRAIVRWFTKKGQPFKQAERRAFDQFADAMITESDDA